jgi:hypothetical protein
MPWHNIGLIFQVWFSQVDSNSSLVWSIFSSHFLSYLTSRQVFGVTFAPGRNPRKVPRLWIPSYRLQGNGLEIGAKAEVLFYQEELS